MKKDFENDELTVVNLRESYLDDRSSGVVVWMLLSFVFVLGLVVGWFVTETRSSIIKTQCEVERAVQQ